MRSLHDFVTRLKRIAVIRCEAEEDSADRLEMRGYIAAKVRLGS